MGRRSDLTGPYAVRREVAYIVGQVVAEARELGFAADVVAVAAFVSPMVTRARDDRQLIIAKALAWLEERSEAA